MAETRKIDDKGRVTIPKGVRESLGLEPGEEVRLSVEGGSVVVRPMVSREEFIEEMVGCINEETRREDAEEVDPFDPLGLDDPLGADG
ncbi:MAG: AbrB/MazE/SpoVT family DNA-binding domain-containing protein [Halobacteriales archaeon]|nr:AbrB/MazE/SpoVT family DNA-binding domain-containing protein [Halobacteriales archaeon]